MKIRSGFVSNSSSSSFCIYGICSSDTELPERFGSDYIGWDRAINELNLIDKRFGHHFMSPDTHFIGISFSAIKDSETGKQFKDDVTAAIVSVLGKPVNCKIHETAWYYG